VKSGTKQSVYLFVRDNYTQTRINTNLKVLVEEWDKEKQRVKKNYPESSVINYNLELLKKKSQNIINEGIVNKKNTNEIITELKILYKPQKQSEYTFMNLCDDYLDNSEQQNEYGTTKAYRVTVNNLKQFEKYTGLKIVFEDFDNQFYNEYQRFCFNVLSHSKNFFGKNVRVLKSILHYGVNEKKLNINADFKRFKVLKEDTDNIYLSKDEILKIYNLDLTQQKNKSIDKVRDFFVLSCETALRFSDLTGLKNSNIKRNAGKMSIEKRVIKTNENIVIPLSTLAIQIIEKYSENGIFTAPALISNQKTNVMLKRIGEMAEINEQIQVVKYIGGKRTEKTFLKYEMIKTHTGRRSFASNLYLKGCPSSWLMKATGHRTEKSFLSYIKASNLKIADEIEKFID
jgi:integrase